MKTEVLLIGIVLVGAVMLGSGMWYGDIQNTYGTYMGNVTSNETFLKFNQSVTEMNRTMGDLIDKSTNIGQKDIISNAWDSLVLAVTALPVIPQAIGFATNSISMIRAMLPVGVGDWFFLIGGIIIVIIIAVKVYKVISRSDDS